MNLPVCGVGDGIVLEGYDAGISCRTLHRPSTGLTWTVVSNWSDGAWIRIVVRRSRPGNGHTPERLGLLSGAVDVVADVDEQAKEVVGEPVEGVVGGDGGVDGSVQAG